MAYCTLGLPLPITKHDCSKTKTLRTTWNMKGQCRHNKRVGIQGAPEIVIFILYTTDDYTEPWHEVRRHTPSHHIISISMQEGIHPSPSHCHSNFEATREGMLLPVVSLLFQCIEEGYAPPHCVVLPVLKRWGGWTPCRHLLALLTIMPLVVINIILYTYLLIIYLFADLWKPLTHTHKTHTRECGYTFWWVWVQITLENPRVACDIP